MGQPTQRPRLDEILVREGLISETQIREALQRQKAFGGKFGSQLLYHRYLDEATLVTALSIQFDCEGVVLTDYDIPDILLRMVPKKVALARKVVPFDYDTDHNILKIACEDPTDHNLINELSFVARGKEVKLYVAAELALTTAIARYYLGQQVSLNDNLLLDIPDFATATEKVPVASSTGAPAPAESARPGVLLVTDEKFAAPLLQSLFERDQYRVVVCESADEAIAQLTSQKFHSVLIKDTVSGDYLDLIDQVRKTSPQTMVRYYSAASSLLLNTDTLTAVADLLIRNLDLFTALLTSKAQLPVNHGGRVGRYTDRLCRKLGLPDKDRIMICNIAYIHNLARFYYSTDESEDDRRVIQLTVKLLASLNYPPTVVEMLRLMYIDLAGGYSKRLPIEVLGGNILTIVDLFCENVPLSDHLTLDKFDAIKKKLRALVGKLFLSEVVEAFIDMMQEEILDLHATLKVGQVMIYSADPHLLRPLEMRLKNEGLRTLSHTDKAAFLELFKRSEPDILVLAVSGGPGEISSLLVELKEGGVRFEHIPTFVMAERLVVPGLTGLLERGIEDIIALDDNLDLLVSKIRKLQVRKQGQAQPDGGGSEAASGARGRLADMNLIDLIQALGPGRKTVKITVQPNRPTTTPLLLYLSQGQITFAAFQHLVGADAVYEGVTWTDGTWTIEPALAEEIPPANNDQSNESILMEGCRLMDEKVKAGQLL